MDFFWNGGRIIFVIIFGKVDVLRCRRTRRKENSFSVSLLIHLIQGILLIREIQNLWITIWMKRTSNWMKSHRCNRLKEKWVRVQVKLFLIFSYRMCHGFRLMKRDVFFQERFLQWKNPLHFISTDFKIYLQLHRNLATQIISIQDFQELIFL